MKITIGRQDQSNYRAILVDADLKVLQAARREDEAERLLEDDQELLPLHADIQELGDEGIATFERDLDTMLEVRGLFVAFQSRTPDVVASIIESRPAFDDKSETYRRRHDMGQKAGALAMQMEAELMELGGVVAIDREVLSEQFSQFLKAEAVWQEPPAAAYSALPVYCPASTDVYLTN